MTTRPVDCAVCGRVITEGPDGSWAATPAPDERLRAAAQAVVDEWDQTVADGGLVTIAVAEPIDALREALATTPTSDSVDEGEGS